MGDLRNSHLRTWQEAACAWTDAGSSVSGGNCLSFRPLTLGHQVHGKQRGNEASGKAHQPGRHVAMRKVIQVAPKKPPADMPTMPKAFWPA